MGAPFVDPDGYRVVGSHRIRPEPPDTLHARLVGDLSASDVLGLLDALDEIPVGPPVFLLRDARRGGAPSQEAREIIIKDPRIARLAAVINYGASFHTRVVLTMISKAMRFVRPTAPTFHFVASEAEGRALIAEKRARAA